MPQILPITATLVALLAGAASSYGQSVLELTCPPADTAACVDALPAPDPGLVTVFSTCEDPSGGGTAGGGAGGNGGAGGASTECRADTSGCYVATFVELVRDSAAGTTAVTVEIAYGEAAGCRHAVSHVAFSLPAGVGADFEGASGDGGTYLGELGAYEVENTTNNPFYSIKFESTGDGFAPGGTERFAFTVASASAYLDAPLTIRVKAGQTLADLTLAGDCSTEPDGGAGGGAAGVDVRWDFDYIIPGGTGCPDDPIYVIRGYSAFDACGNSSSCDQDLYVLSDCDGAGVPVGCGADSSSTGGTAVGRTIVETGNIWGPEGDRAAIWGPVEPRLGTGDADLDGYYSVNVLRPEDDGPEDVWGPEEIARVAPRGAASYTFEHRAIAVGDSLQVIWVGPTDQLVSSAPERIELGAVVTYPNPGSLRFTVTTAAFAKTGGTVAVFDAVGRLQHHEAFAVGRARVELATETWRPGVYTVLVSGAADGAAARGRWLLSR